MRCPPRLRRGDRPPGGHSELGPVPSLEGSPLTTLDTLLEEIRTGPSGPQIAAFFDFDGTLIDGYWAAALSSPRLRNFEIGPVEAAHTVLAEGPAQASEHRVRSLDRSDLEVAQPV